ncbi:cytochrome P450 [Aeromicrobium wangtongii]|uniref:Cytochrome P450 n=1 Tax=Aeromicrobium wangtongii TaxID=2969247 RepID=A0ABY5M8P4_9ACTN|nr:cytochrome P450 [Aeromicrobium wangtongii]MCD9198944.1 cytochrome P450 [Aeromicrobium wangtongii]UUP13018.1 cytochrome P450 [Aeromicrobium wangtongii]
MTTNMDDEMLSTSAVNDPYGYLGGLRATDPVYWNARYRSWVLTRHADVSVAMTDTRFSSDRIAPVIARERARARPDLDLIETFELLDRWLVFRDPPEHTRFRRLVHKAFSPRIIASMRGEVERVADDLVDAARVQADASDGVIDLIREVAFPLPAIVIASMLGVPAQDRDRFKDWSDDISALVFGALDDPGRHSRARLGMMELVNYISSLLDRVREAPDDHLASALVQATDGDESLTDDELIAICVNLLFGGHETTTNLIANSVLAFIEHPDQADLLRADTSLAGAAIEEMLRFDGPAKSVVRIAAEDIEMGDKTIRAGDRVFVMLAGANRDPDVFEDPDRFDITRKGGGHLGFGVGVHYCLGATLARLEGTVVVPRLLERFPEMELADEELEWDRVILTRGMKRLPVRLNAS